MAGRFIHLHTHSHYSFLQALPKLDELVEKAKEEGMDAVALTDAGNLHGAIEFYKAATKEGVKPILGVDAYVAPASRHAREHGEKRSRLVLLVENMTGYKNLLKLVTRSYTEGLHERPRVDRELLKEYAEGLIALIPSFSGAPSLALMQGDFEGAAASVAEYQSIFGKEDVYLEITHHPKIDGHEERMKGIRKLSEATGAPLVAQHDVYYLSPDDQEACAVLRRIQQGAEGRAEQEDFSFVGEAAMRKWFSDLPEAVEESGRIADRCSIEFSLGKWIFPEVETENGKTHDEMLRERAYAGLVRRRMEKTAEVEERIEYELKVIGDKGFAPYFLAVSDLLGFARENGILTTTRGSAGGSLVSYLVGITNTDPMFYQLPFERFLNPERPKAPDIDMDFADNRRGEVIAYAKRKYGEDRVAQIGTFGTMLARAAVRDVARALGHSYGTGDRIAKLIPQGSQGFPMTIDRALVDSEDLALLYHEDDEVREVVDLAKRIEGCVRQVGVHAAGVVVAPTTLTDWVPLQYDPKSTDERGVLITQYDMYSVTDEYGGVGLLKFDFLGIRNLAIIGDAVERIRSGRGVAIDIENVPLDDTKTFEMLSRGETEGTFQLNGSGMTRYLKELRPTTIHDINAMVALYRPGPIETIPQYIERKRNPRLIRFLDERMKEYLGASYGLIVYQDDVLLTAVKLAGYTWLQADALRKAMGKKIPAEMEAQKENLIKGFLEYGKLTPEKAEEIWKLIEPFAAYGFNKAHAASYGKVAYQTAYLKANYPVEYMAAILTAESGDIDTIAIMVAECERMKIPVLPPDINESGSTFTVVSDGAAIRFGLSSIKNFGEGISEAIMAERQAKGPFASLSDFLVRVGDRNLNRKSLEALIKCGALDRFADGGDARSHLLAHIDTLVAFHKDATAPAEQAALFASVAPTLSLPPATSTTNLKDKLDWERELLGIYVSGHPLDAHTDKTAKAGTGIAKLLAEPIPGMTVILPVLVTEARAILTKSGEKMAFLKVEDKTGSIEAVAFPKLFKEHSALFEPNQCVLVKAKVANRNGELSLALENAKPL